MKKLNKNSVFVVAFLLLATNGFAQYRNNWAIGAKVGEPLGINLRKYFNEGSRSFDLNFGTYGFIYGKDVKYKGADCYDRAGIMIQGMYNYQYVFGKESRLHGYFGYGAQINSRRLIQPVGSRELGIKQISVGGAGNLGLEYALPNTDLGIFIETGAYLELLPKVFLAHSQINAGLRLNIIR